MTIYLTCRSLTSSHKIEDGPPDPRREVPRPFPRPESPFSPYNYCIAGMGVMTIYLTCRSVTRSHGVRTGTPDPRMEVPRPIHRPESCFFSYNYCISRIRVMPIYLTCQSSNTSFKGWGLNPSLSDGSLSLVTPTPTLLGYTPRSTWSEPLSIAPALRTRGSSDGGARLASATPGS